MPNLHIQIANKTATYTLRDGAVVCDNTDYTAVFTFDEEWAAETARVARFVWNGRHHDVDIAADGTCAVPRITGAKVLHVGVYAGELRTTTSAEIPCEASILSKPTEPGEEYAAGYVEEIREAVRHTDEVAKATEEMLGDAGSTLSRVEKELTNLRQAVAPEYFQTDSGVAYTKTVPDAALPFAEVTEVGGMTYAQDGILKHTAVTALEVQGRNILDISAVKHTYPIPAEVQALEGWGEGISADCHNRLDWSAKQYRQEVMKIRLDGSETWGRSSATHIFQADYKLPQIAGDTQKFPAIISNGYDFHYWMDPAKEKPFFRISKNGNQLWIEETVDAYANVDEWKAYLAANPVEIVYPLGTPIVTDLPDLPDDNFIEVEGGGTITAMNQYGLAVPTAITYQLKEA